MADNLKRATGRCAAHLHERNRDGEKRNGCRKSPFSGGNGCRSGATLTIDARGRLSG